MTQPSDYNYKPCDKLDGECVEAFVDLSYDPELYGGTVVLLSSTWGSTPFDMEPIVKAGETITTLYLTPENNPVSLQYDKEGGTHDCIEGDDLSRIVSLRYLKDVEQTTPQNGMVYMYNSSTSLFSPYNLGNFVSATNNHLSSLDGSVTNLNSSVSQLRTDLNTLTSTMNQLVAQLQANIDAEAATRAAQDTALSNAITNLSDSLSALANRVTAIEAKLTPPAGSPANVGVAFGNINIYSDSTNANHKTSGIYTHAPSENRTNDEYFA